VESKNKRIQKSVKENTATIRETEGMVRRTREELVAGERETSMRRMRCKRR